MALVKVKEGQRGYYLRIRESGEVFDYPGSIVGSSWLEPAGAGAAPSVFADGAGEPSATLSGMQAATGGRPFGKEKRTPRE